MSSIGIFSGLNVYPSPNELAGCVTDAERLSVLCAGQFGLGKHVMLRDEEATTYALSRALREAVAELRPGDKFVFSYSGHGSENARGDVICPIDFDGTDERSLGVADFFDIFRHIPRGVSAVWISDSCYSGGLDGPPADAGKARAFRSKPRLWQRSTTRPWPGSRVATQQNFKDFVSEQLPEIVLLAGASTDQTAADARIDGEPCGAFSHYLEQALMLGDDLWSLADVVVDVNDRLKAAGYSQEAQAAGPPHLVNAPFLSAVK